MQTLLEDIDWFKKMVDVQLILLQNTINSTQKTFTAPKLPSLDHKDYYTAFIKKYRLSYAERLLIAMAGIAIVEPTWLTKRAVVGKYIRTGHDSENIGVSFQQPYFLEMGLVRDHYTGYFHATNDTFIQLMSSNNAAARVKSMRFLDKEAQLVELGVIVPQNIASDYNKQLAFYTLNPKYFKLFTK